MLEIKKPLLTIELGNARQRAVQPRSGPWNKGVIAKLTTLQIEQMPAEDLVEIVAQMNPYLPQRIGRKRLEFSDRATLERLAYLVRRSCRNQGY